MCHLKDLVGQLKTRVHMLFLFVYTINISFFMPTDQHVHIEIHQCFYILLIHTSMHTIKASQYKEHPGIYIYYINHAWTQRHKYMYIYTYTKINMYRFQPRARCQLGARCQKERDTSTEGLFQSSTQNSVCVCAPSQGFFVNTLRLCV